MDNYYVRTDTLVLSTVFAVVTGICRLKLFDKGTRIFFLISVLSFITEAAAFYAAVRLRNNIPVYNVLNLAEILLICIYFNFVSKILHRRNTGVYLGIISVAAGIVYECCVITIYQVPDNFLTYQTLLTVILSMVTLYGFLAEEDTGAVTREVHFWLPTILMFRAAITHFLFVLVKFYMIKSPDTARHITFTLSIVNIAWNCAIGVVYYLYPKLNTHVR